MATSAAQEAASAPEQQDWPAPAQAMQAGCDFLRSSAAHGKRVVIAADRDVDGLSSAVQVQRCLERLGAPTPEIIAAAKGEHVHEPRMQARLLAARPDALVVVDMGSRAGTILEGVPLLLLDHHQPHGFPVGAVVVSAFGHEPVAPTALLTHELVRTLVPAEDLLWLALLGGAADLGSDLPFARLAQAARQHTRKSVTESVALLNAARRTGEQEIATALSVLLAAGGPADIAAGRVEGVDVLRHCRAEVQEELKRCGRSAPKMSGALAVVRISSGAQIHPLLAARWSRRLPSAVVLVANDGYIEGRVNFAMRTQLPVNMVERLRAMPLSEHRDAFGFGHPAATGGSLPPDAFERVVQALATDPEVGARQVMRRRKSAAAR